MRFPTLARVAPHLLSAPCLCLLACGRELTRPPGPLLLTALPGAQEGRVAELLPTPVRVQVSTGSGEPAPNITVRWRVDAGALSDTATSTDGNGIASVRWTLDTMAGVEHASASVDGSLPISYTVRALPGTPLSLTITPGDATLEPDSTIQLSATGADRYGNQILASQVMWTSQVAVVASVLPSGLVTGGRAGVSLVQATVDDITAAVRVTVPAHWRAIAAGRLHTCALDSLGYAFCWGANDQGQLGFDGIASSSVPVPVVTALQFIDLAAGREHTCALTAEGAAYCWGRNAEGQLGIGSLQAAPTGVPLLVTGGRQFRSIAANDGVHTCALTVGNAAMCWGWEAEGELGNGESLTFRGEPTPQMVLGGLVFETLATGGSHTCGLDPTGVAYCWGNDASGQVGDNSQQVPPYRAAPVAVAGGLRFKSIGAGASHTCAVTPDGEAYCWGLNDVGQLGNGNVLAEVPSPTPVRTTLAFADITASESTTCGLTLPGEVFCWGRNGAGQLGDGTTLDQGVPTRAHTTVLFKRITVGWSHVCAITAPGAGYCWGANDEGQLGIGTVAPQRVPAMIVAPR